MLPALRAACEEHVKRCEARGVRVALVSVRRTVDQQRALFEKGRRWNGAEWVKVGPIVTNAPPEEAPHCPRRDAAGYIGSAAYDLAVVGADEKPVWNLPDGSVHPAYAEVLGPIGEELGLGWGGSWIHFKDWDHFELRDWRGMPLAVGATRPGHRNGLPE